MIQPISISCNNHSYKKNSGLKNENVSFKGSKLEVLGENVLKNGDLANATKELAENLYHSTILNNGVKINIAQSASDLMSQKGSIIEHIMPSGTKVDITLHDVLVQKVGQLGPNTTISHLNPTAQSFGEAEEMVKLIHFTQDGNPVSMLVPKSSIKSGVIDANNIVVPVKPESVAKDASSIPSFESAEEMDKLIHFTPDGLPYTIEIPKGSLKPGFLDGNNLVIPAETTPAEMFNEIMKSNPNLTDANPIFQDFLTSTGEIPVGTVTGVNDISEGIGDNGIFSDFLDILGG